MSSRRTWGSWLDSLVVGESNSQMADIRSFGPLRGCFAKTSEVWASEVTVTLRFTLLMGKGGVRNLLKLEKTEVRSYRKTPFPLDVSFPTCVISPHNSQGNSSRQTSIGALSQTGPTKPLIHVG